MSDLNRRTFIAAAGGAAVTAALAGTGLGAGAAAAASPSARRAATVPTTNQEVRALVIGSGFGGGVAALRLAQAGVPVLVLERGKRWPTGPNAETFPHATSPDKRALWMANPVSLFGLININIVDRYVGLLESVTGDNMTAMCAAGVGGGSLVYQGMTLQPSASVFNANLPPALDYARMSSVYYPRVASMLQVQTAPDELVNSPTYTAARVFASYAKNAGQTVEKIPMPIDWSFALRELKGEMKPSYTNGDCGLGVNNGGKHSVDVTYIAQAEATGKVTVAIQHNVTDVERANDGRWVVRADRIAEDGTVLEKKVITAKALIMGAGSCNTTKLLMRAKGLGKISNLPDALGTNWGTNGDQICTWTNLLDDFTSPQGGPVVYGTKDWTNPTTANTIIQASLPPLPNLRTTLIVGYGISSGRGKWVFDTSTGEAELTWPKTGDAAIANTIKTRMNKIVGIGGAILDTTDASPSTWHPVGGASMGSVCDLSGRVIGQKGLYVLDGALLPGNSAACNPSMTIAAVAERALDDIVAHDLGTAI